MYTGFRSKADVVKFAILNCTDTKAGKIDFEQAQEIINFIYKNVQLPEVTKAPLEDNLEPLINSLSEVIKKISANEPSYVVGAL